MPFKTIISLTDRCCAQKAMRRFFKQGRRDFTRDYCNIQNMLLLTCNSFKRSNQEHLDSCEFFLLKIVFYILFLICNDGLGMIIIKKTEKTIQIEIITSSLFLGASESHVFTLFHKIKATDLQELRCVRVCRDNAKSWIVDHFSVLSYLYYSCN